MSVFGALRHAGHVERAVIDALNAWMPAMQVEVARQDAARELDADATPEEIDEARLELPALRAVLTKSEFLRWPEDQLPCAVVISPGTTGDTRKNAEGYFSATYSVAVAVMVSASTEESTRDVGHLYGAAVRKSLLLGRTLGRQLEVTDWTGESLDDLPAEESRSLFAVVNSFDVELGQVVSWKHGPAPTYPPEGGPPEPPDPPEDPTDWPPGPWRADEVHIVVDEKES